MTDPCVACQQPAWAGLRFTFLEGQPILCDLCMARRLCPTGVFAWDGDTQRAYEAHEARQARRQASRRWWCWRWGASEK